MTVLACDGLSDRAVALKWEELGGGIGGFNTLTRHASGGGGRTVLTNASASNPTGRGLRFTVGEQTHLFAAVAMSDPTHSDRFVPFAFADGATSILTVAIYKSTKNMELLQGAQNGTLLGTHVVNEDWASGVANSIHVEVELDATAGEARLYVDGELVIEATGLTIAAPTSVCIGGTSSSSTSTLRQLQFEDFVAADARIGDARVLSLTPSAAGALAEFDPSDGTSANWELVLAGAAIDPDKFVTTDTHGARDSHELPALFADVDRPDLLAVQAWATGTKTDATTRELAAGVRIGTTNYDSDTVELTGGATAKKLWTANPATSAVWTKTAVDAMELTYVATKP